MEPSPDGRWVIVDGRRWRASDPAIPAPLRQELVDALMAARRAVGAARRADDPEAEARAREGVQAAKVALGERGEPWWEEPSPAGRRERLAATVVALAAHRGPDRTICPSDAARIVGGDGWRSLMDDTRAEVRRLAAAGQVEVLQKGHPVPPKDPWKGPIRIRLAKPASW